MPTSPRRESPHSEQQQEQQLLDDCLQYACCLFLQGKKCELGKKCPYQHSHEVSVPCQYGDDCVLKHYKRNWAACDASAECSSCGKFFWKIFPWRRKHHCRLDGKVVCINCLNRDYQPYPICARCEKSIEVVVEKRILEEERVAAETEKTKQVVKARWKKFSSNVTLQEKIKAAEDEDMKQKLENLQKKPKSLLSRVAALGKNESTTTSSSSLPAIPSSAASNQKQEEPSKTSFFASAMKKIVAPSSSASSHFVKNAEGKSKKITCNDFSSDDEMFESHSDYSSSDSDYDEDVVNRNNYIDHSLEDILMDNVEIAADTSKNDGNNTKNNTLTKKNVKFEDQIQQEREEAAAFDILFRSGPYGSRVMRKNDDIFVTSEKNTSKKTNSGNDDDGDDFDPDSFFCNDNNNTNNHKHKISTSSTVVIPIPKYFPPSKNQNQNSVFFFGVRDKDEFDFLEENQQHHNDNNFDENDDDFSFEKDEFFKAGSPKVKQHAQECFIDNSTVIVFDHHRHQPSSSSSSSSLNNNKNNNTNNNNIGTNANSKSVLHEKYFEDTKKLLGSNKKSSTIPTTPTLQRQSSRLRELLMKSANDNNNEVSVTETQIPTIVANQNTAEASNSSSSSTASLTAAQLLSSSSANQDSSSSTDPTLSRTRSSSVLSAKNDIGLFARKLSVVKSAEQQETEASKNFTEIYQKNLDLSTSEDKLAERIFQRKESYSELKKRESHERERRKQEQELDDWMRHESWCCGPCAGTKWGRKCGTAARLWRRFGVEIVMILTLLTIAFVSAFFLIRLTVTHFTRHQECVACFSGSGGGNSNVVNNNNNNNNDNNISTSNFSTSTILSPSWSPSGKIVGYNITSNLCVTAADILRNSQANTQSLTSNNNNNNNNGGNGIEPDMYDMWDIITDQAFCGVPECRALETLPLFRPLPYWVSLLGTFAGILSCATVNLFKKFVLTPLKVRLCGHVDVVRMMSKEARGLAFRFFIFGSTDAYWFAFLWLLTITNLALKIYVVCFQNERYAHASVFQKYEAINLLWLNSGTCQVLCLFYVQILNGTVGATFITNAKCPKSERSFLGDGERSILAKMVIPLGSLDIFGERNALMAHVWLLPLPLLPIFISHVLPGLVIFFPVPFLMLAVWFMSGKIFDKYYSRRRFSKKMQIFLLMLFRVLSNFTLMVLFLTLVTYSTLMYSKISSFTDIFSSSSSMGANTPLWTEIIITEFSRRNSLCYANSVSNSIQAYNLGFASMLLN